MISPACSLLCQCLPRLGRYSKQITAAVIEGKSITEAQWSAFGEGGVTVAEPSPLNWGHPDEISGNVEIVHGHSGCNMGIRIYFI